MPSDFSRTEILVGSQTLARLKASTVCVVGLGGVGSYAAEALARSGIGSFILIDFDTVGPTNINRQLLATTQSIGKAKTELDARAHPFHQSRCPHHLPSGLY
jgi:tRNA A37 threonylcarbamoyladenosine dehydratase